MIKILIAVLLMFVITAFGFFGLMRGEEYLEGKFDEKE